MKSVEANDGCDRRLESHSSLLLFGIVAIFFVIRLYRATWGYYFEWDEYMTFNYAQYTWTGLQTMIQNEIWPPLYLVIYKGVINAVNGSIFGARLFSMMCSLATLLLAYWFCKKEFGVRAAMLTAVLLAISPVDVTYSTLARLYSFIGFWTVLLGVSAYYLCQRDWVWDWLIFALSCCVLVYSHFLCAFILISLYLYLAVVFLWKRKFDALARLVLVGVLLLMVFLPYVPVFVGQLELVTHWNVSHLYEIKSLYLYPIDAFVVHAGGKVGAPLLGLLLLLSILFPRVPFSRKAWQFFGVFFAVVLLGNMLNIAYHQWFSPMYNASRSSMLYHGVVLIMTGIILANIRWRALLLLVIVCLGLNCGRLVVTNRMGLNLSTSSIHTATLITEHIPKNTDIYMVNATVYQGFPQLHAYLDPGYYVRELWTVKEDYLLRHTTNFLYYDVRLKGNVLLFLKRSAETVSYLEVLRKDPLLRSLKYTEIAIADAPEYRFIFLQKDPDE